MLADFEVPHKIQLGEYSMSSGTDGMVHISSLGCERELELRQRLERRGELRYEP
jgi:hypothetical protein